MKISAFILRDIAAPSSSVEQFENIKPVAVF